MRQPLLLYFAGKEMIDPSALVLVVVMKSPRDLEIARVLGWYRIPLRSAPKIIAVDYLAFYQTAAFQGEKWSIHYLAEVRGYELTTRAELLHEEMDHPHANQEYYKIQLGPLFPLENPIPAKDWKRITFFYTTGECILKAETISDLILREEDRITLWRALRERSDNHYLSRDTLELPDEINSQMLAMLLGLKSAPNQDNFR
ncbi:MAG: hypothetical protein ACPL4H_08515 [Anaerolineales bacterium]